MRMAVSALLVIACALCAGCGTGARPAATMAGNKSLTTAEARRLLALEPVPAGARAVPVTLPGPALGRPTTGPLIDLQRQWRLAMPFAQAAAWLKAHPPAGLGRPLVNRSTSPLGRVPMP